MIPSRQWVTTGLLIAGALWVPLPAASVTPAGELAVRLLGLAAAIAAAGSRPTLRRSKLALTAASALLALALLGLGQAQRWPSGLVRLVSPEHYRLAVQASAAVHAGAAVEQGTPEIDRVFLSLAPRRSRSVALSLCSTAAVFLAALVVGGRRSQRRGLALAVVAAGFVQLLVGARPFAGGSVARLRGTFVNPDHLALLLEISLSVCFAWAVWALRRRRGRSPISMEKRLAQIGAPVLAWLFLFAGLSFTGSRAGLMAALTAAAVQTALLWKALPRSVGESRRWRGRRVLRLPVLAVLALALAAAAWVARQAGFGRLLATSRYELFAAERFRVWGESLELVGRFPLLGSGLGSFRETFEQVQPAADSSWIWTRAHNDYLELLVTTGFLGLALGVVGLVALALALWRGVCRRKYTEDRLAALAGWGVFVSLGLHEAFDFGATLPATSFISAVVLGAALSPPARQGPKPLDDRELRPRSPEDRLGPGSPVDRRS